MYFRVLFSACLIVTPGLSVIVRAAEWTAEPAITGRYEYNDNINLSIQPHSSVRGSFLTPSLDLAVNMPVWQVSAGLSATQRRYSGQAGLDRDDKTSWLSTAYQTERHTWQLAASRSLDSLLSTDIITPDTGVAQAQLQTETRSISPSWIWRYSELTTLKAVYQQSTISYDEDILNSSLYNYDYWATTARLSRQITEVNEIFVTGGYSRFRVPNTGFRSDTRSFQVGATRTFSETVQGTLQAGRRSTESLTRGGNPIYTLYSFIDPISGQIVDIKVQTGVTQDSREENTGAVFDGNLERKFERALARLTLSRSLNPTGSGGQSVQDTLGLIISHPLKERMTFSMNANLLETSYISGNITNTGLTYYDLSPGLNWQLLRDWTLGLNYRYAHVKRVSESESGKSNSVYSFVTYRPTKLSVSR